MHRGHIGTAMHTIRLRRPAPEPPPVDPDALDPASQERREQYLQARAERAAAAEKFVPRNQRNLKLDEKGRVVAPDIRDQPPTWLRQI
jgi:hypothetical protein